MSDLHETLAKFRKEITSIGHSFRGSRPDEQKTLSAAIATITAPLVCITAASDGEQPVDSDLRTIQPEIKHMEADRWLPIAAENVQDKLSQKSFRSDTVSDEGEENETQSTCSSCDYESSDSSQTGSDASDDHRSSSSTKEMERTVIQQEDIPDITIAADQTQQMFHNDHVPGILEETVAMIPAKESLTNMHCDDVIVDEDVSITMLDDLSIDSSLDDSSLYVIGKQGRAHEPSYYFNRDKKTMIDMVIAYKIIDDDDMLHDMDWTTVDYYRRAFEKRLAEANLKFEHEIPDNPESGCSGFLKIHATWPCLARQAVKLRLKVPLVGEEKSQHSKVLSTNRKLRNRLQCCQFLKAVDQQDLCEKEYSCKVRFDPRRQDAFDLHDADNVFNIGDRIRMVWNELQHISIPRLDYHRRKSSDSSESWNLFSLLEKGIYSDIYPLHDSCPAYDSERDPFRKLPHKQLPVRYWLYKYWGRWTSFLYQQPLDGINRYFGAHYGLYFAMLGMYVKWLIILALIGLAATFFGAYRLSQDQVIQTFMCKPQHADNVALCRLCRSTLCPYTTKLDECNYARLSRFVDNIGTVLFALATCIWGTIFLTCWRRQQVRLSTRWAVGSTEMLAPRGKYVHKVTTKRLNPVTLKDEQYLPKSKRRLRLVASFAVVVFYMNLLIAFIMAIAVHRVVAYGLYYRMGFSNWKYYKADMVLVISICASVLNSVIIAVLGLVYQKVGVWLTEFEYPRTEVQYVKSYTYKVFMFEFVNNYGTLFYLILKGNFKDSILNMDDFSNNCPLSGCVPQVTIQLIMVLTVKQMFHSILEVIIPALKRWWRRHNSEHARISSNLSRAAQDYILLPTIKPETNNDHLEMVIQYGFIVLFAAAFPLAPCFAFLSNIMEIRIDAYKHLVHHRRPIPVRLHHLVCWVTISEYVTNLAIITNAVIIAFTTDFIDRYMYSHFLEAKPMGYLFYASTLYNTSDIFGAEDPALLTDENGTHIHQCLARGYYYHNNERTGLAYTRHANWWVVMTGRCMFVILFVCVALIVKELVKQWLPTMPSDVRTHKRRERYVKDECMLKLEQELRHRQKSTSDTQSLLH